MIRLALLVASVFVSFTTSADVEKDITAQKTEIMSKVDAHIATLQSHKNCISAAKDKAAIMACKSNMREVHMENKENRMEKRAEMMKMRQEHMKNRMDAKKGESKEEAPAAPAQ
jgi:hypothetical protein